MGVEGCSSLRDLRPLAVPFLFGPHVCSSKHLQSTLSLEKCIARREAGARQEAERERASQPAQDTRTSQDFQWCSKGLCQHSPRPLQVLWLHEDCTALG